MKNFKLSLVAIALLVAVSASAFSKFGISQVISKPDNQDRTQAVLAVGLEAYTEEHCTPNPDITCLVVTDESGTFEVKGQFN